MTTNRLMITSVLLSLTGFGACRESTALHKEQVQTATSPQKGGAVKSVEPGPAVASAGEASLGISCESPVELVVTDPEGRKLGGDPIAHKSYDEIPRAYYESEGIEDAETGARESDPAKTLFIPSPIRGKYIASIIATRTGRYTCDFMGDDVAGTHSDRRLERVPIARGEIHQIAFEFDGSRGSNIGLSGGFNPANGPPSDSRPLSYASPTTSTVRIPRDRHEVLLFVFYGPNFDPSSFSATLNDNSVNALFHPQPATWEWLSVPVTGSADKLVVKAAIAGRTQSVDTFEILIQK